MPLAFCGTCRRNVPATVLCLYARKGGAGRSLMTQQLAGACAEKGARVLVVDQDPQASISKNFLGRDAVERFRPHETAAAFYDTTISDYSSLIRKTEIENIAIVPSSDYLEEYDRPLPNPDKSRSHEEREELKRERYYLEFALKTFIDSVIDSFDVIWIDTPPNASNVPAWAALNASDFVMTPVIPDKNHVEALPDVNARLKRVMETTNPDLVNLGCFLTGYQAGLSVHRFVQQKMRQLYGHQVFDVVIPHRVAFKEAVWQHTPLTHLKPRSEAAEAILWMAHASEPA